MTQAPSSWAPSGGEMIAEEKSKSSSSSSSSPWSLLLSLLSLSLSLLLLLLLLSNPQSRGLQGATKYAVTQSLHVPQAKFGREWNSGLVFTEDIQWNRSKFAPFLTNLRKSIHQKPTIPEFSRPGDFDLDQQKVDAASLSQVADSKDCLRTLEPLIDFSQAVTYCSISACETLSKWNSLTRMVKHQSIQSRGAKK